MSERFARMIGIVSLASVAVSAFVSGCATVPMSSAQDSARMKWLAAPPDAALIYVYRNETIGYSVHMDVSLDGVPYGQTVAKSFMVWEVRPGRHQLLSQAENDSVLTVDAMPGRRYFVWQEVKMGIMYARSRLQEVSEGEGQGGVNECELIQMPLPRPRPLAPRAPAPVHAPEPLPLGAPQTVPPSPPVPPTS